MRLNMTPEEVFQLWFLCDFIKHKVPILATFLTALHITTCERRLFCLLILGTVHPGEEI